MRIISLHPSYSQRRWRPHKQTWLWLPLSCWTWLLLAPRAHARKFLTARQGETETSLPPFSTHISFHFICGGKRRQPEVTSSAQRAAMSSRLTETCCCWALYRNPGVSPSLNVFFERLGLFLSGQRENTGNQPSLAISHCEYSHPISNVYCSDTV